MRLLSLCCLLAASCLAGSAQAGIIFNVAGFDSDVLNNGVVVAPGTDRAVVDVYISTDDDSQLFALNLALDISAVSSVANPGPDGRGRPNGLEFNSAPIMLGVQGGVLGPALGTGLNTGSNLAVDIDGLINLDSFSGTPRSPTVGFSIVFDVGDVAPGRYWLNLSDNTSPIDLAGITVSSGNNNFSSTGGYLEVIPEPGSMGLVAVCTWMIASVRRRRASRS